MDQVLKRQSAKTHKKEIGNLNKPMSIRKTESIIDNPLKRKHQAQMGSVVSSIKY